MSRIASLSSELLGVGVLWVVLGACAQGFEGPQAFGFDAPGSSQGGGQVGNDDDDVPAAGSGVMAGTGGSSGAAGMAAYDGEPCNRGETEACACPGGGMGTRSCGFDAASPTEGSFGACMRCSNPAGSGGSGGSGGGGSGGSGGGGSGGSGGGGGSGGSGGSGSSGSGGSGSAGSGSAGSGSAGSGGSRPAWCIFVPVPIPGC